MKKTILYAAVIICTLNLPSCKQSDSVNEKVTELIEAKKWNEAYNLINENKDAVIDADNYVYVARNFSEKQLFDYSVPLLEKLIIPFPDNIPGRLLLANNYRETTKYNEAMKIYNDLSQIDSVQFLVLPERSRLYTLLHDFDKARADAQAAKKLQPKYFAVYLAEGLLEYAEGNAEVALDFFEVAEELDPGVSAEASLFAGFILLQSKINLDAMRKFTRAIDVGRNINKGYAFINRGACQMNLSDTAYACADWDSAYFYLPEQAQSYLDQYCKGHRREAAPETFEYKK